MKELSYYKQKDIIPLEDYTIYFQIGKGGQSKVYYAKDNKNGISVAIKVSNDESFTNTFIKETEYMSNCSDPKILKNVSVLKKGLIDKKERIYYAMELAEEGTLHDYISCIEKPFPEFVVRFYVKQILDALEVVHNKGYSHNDLKLENLLLDKDFNIKLTDFGCITPILTKQKNKGFMGASSSQQYVAKVVGSEYYIAPELYQGGYPDGRNDLFGLGVCIFVMLYGFPPFNKATIMDPLFKLLFREKKSEFWKIIGKKSGHVIANDLKDLID